MGGGPGGSGSGVNSSSKASAILMVTFAAFGGVLFGYDTGTISGIIAMESWLRQYGDPQANGAYALTTGNKSLVVSILSAGTFVGALLAYPMGDILGRKLGLMASCVVFCVGVALQTASSALPLFIVGRVVAGLGVGLISCLVPMYQSEVSPKWIRGAVVGCFQWAILYGMLVAAIAMIGTQYRSDSSAYRIPIAIQFIWAAILVGGLAVLPESPRYLVKRGKDAQARRSLSRLLKVPIDDPAVEMEFQDISAYLQSELALGATSYIDCFRNNSGRNRLRTLTGIFLQAFQQLTGINFIFYYGTTFFQNSGITDPFLITIATNVVNVGCTVPGILMIDRLGRRFMLIWGAVGMAVCELIVAVVGTATGTNEVAQKILIAFVCVYIGFFASTWGPIAWVTTGEIFPLAIRAKAMSMATASNWLWNFGIGYATPYMVDSGPGNANLGVKVFFIWFATCFGSAIFAYFFVPETKGLSLEQVDLLYQNSTIIKSNAYRQQLIDADARPTTGVPVGQRLSHMSGGNADHVKDMHHNDIEKREHSTIA